MYSQLDKKSTKNLEFNSDRIESFIYNKQLTKEERENLFNKFMKIISWYHHHGFKGSSKMKDKFAKLSELLGYNPNYYVNYEYRTGIWGLECEGFKFIIYYSLKGMSIQVGNEFQLNKTEEFLDNLIKTLKLDVRSE